MADIFNSQVGSFGGAFSLDDATITFGGVAGGLGVLVQSVDIQYARQVQRIYDLGQARRIYYVVGRPEGNLGITRLAAPMKVASEFIRSFSDVCSIENNQMNISMGLDGRCGRDMSKVNYSLRHCIITAVSFSMQVQQVTMSEQIAMMFAALEVK